MTNKIYIYETPSSKEKGLIKIGQTRGDADVRIKEQINTASVHSKEQLEYKKLREYKAVTVSGVEFSDHDIHRVLDKKGFKKESLDGKNSTEWFCVDINIVDHIIKQFINEVPDEEINIRYQSFEMRPEQKVAVQQTKDYFLKNSNSYKALWNAKMRFGKTFTSYQLMKSMGFKKVLVVTHKPAVVKAWQPDLENHTDFDEYVFLFKENLLRIESNIEKNNGVVAFASFQDLLGEGKESDIKEKHHQLFDTEWDMLIIDEFHYGASTQKSKSIANNTEEFDLSINEDESDEDELSEEEIENKALMLRVKAIKSKYQLYLSGTPFKALANAEFEEEAIFNWTYVDEQKAKEEWSMHYPGIKNPYQELPKIEMLLIKLSEDLIKAGSIRDKDEFGLNHFFEAGKDKKFKNEGAVKKWLDIISGLIKDVRTIDDELDDAPITEEYIYPFDANNPLSKEINHSLWYLNRMDSAYALRSLLQNHPVFSSYEIILAVGKESGSAEETFEKVVKKISQHNKTITITVGKLTTGVSIKEWSAVLFLRDTSSPESYFQTAFRAQTPYKKEDGTYKERCFIIDFSPNRALQLLTKYSEKLSKNKHNFDSLGKIEEFIRYLPVLKIKENSLVEMDAKEVMVFDLSDTDAKGLGKKFLERRNIETSWDALNEIIFKSGNADKCQEIFDKIKDYRNKIGSGEKEEQVDVQKLGQDIDKIKELKAKRVKSLLDDNKESKEKTKEEKEQEKIAKNERDKIITLLSTLLSRIPLYMYLTVATEESLKDVIISDTNDLFRKTTGITVDDFKFLEEIGLIKVESIHSYILRFVELENRVYREKNKMVIV